MSAVVDDEVVGVVVDVEVDGAAELEDGDAPAGAATRELEHPTTTTPAASPSTARIAIRDPSTSES